MSLNLRNCNASQHHISYRAGLNNFDINCNFDDVESTGQIGGVDFDRVLNSLKLLKEHQTVLRFLSDSLKLRFANRELQKFSKELDSFNSLPTELRERIITKILVDNDLALMEFEENLNIIEELDGLKLDANKILQMTKSCNIK